MQFRLTIGALGSVPDWKEELRRPLITSSSGHQSCGYKCRADNTGPVWVTMADERTWEDLPGQDLLPYSTDWIIALYTKLPTDSA